MSSHSAPAPSGAAHGAIVIGGVIGGAPHSAPDAVSASRTAPLGPPGVVVGVDGSDGSLWALDRAFLEAAALRLPLYIVAVVNPAPAGYTPGMADLVQDSVDRLLQGITDVAQRAVASVAARHPDPPYSELHVVLGDPVDILLTASRRHHTLVVGTRGNGGFSRLLLGSVASALAHHAGCAVLLAPPETRNTEPGASVV